MTDNNDKNDNDWQQWPITMTITDYDKNNNDW